MRIQHNRFSRGRLGSQTRLSSWSAAQPPSFKFTPLGGKAAMPAGTSRHRHGAKGQPADSQHLARPGGVFQHPSTGASRVVAGLGHAWSANHELTAVGTVLGDKRHCAAGKLKQTKKQRHKNPNKTMLGYVICQG